MQKSVKQDWRIAKFMPAPGLDQGTWPHLPPRTKKRILCEQFGPHLYTYMIEVWK